MRDRIDLINNGFIDARIRVTNAHRQHTAETVEILVAFIIPDMKTFALN